MKKVISFEFWGLSRSQMKGISGGNAPASCSATCADGSTVSASKCNSCIATDHGSRSVGSVNCDGQITKCCVE